ncbi:hypothetical protein SCP_1500290 [Sparassis crispa]|uniref:Uncharacterized protein n=1 Tax=Sparassis crispa TaxID=139825 RepID=A0A401H3M0_9APHY|nr:hypothetical protein SCP_1500290 [Sparassis crispa]GBE89027.1 hypothetical protein SCP_1500290 [Sparassis crispa]
MLFVAVNVATIFEKTTTSSYSEVPQESHLFDIGPPSVTYFLESHRTPSYQGTRFPGTAFCIAMKYSDSVF